MIETSVHEAIAQVENDTDFTVLLHQADLELLQKTCSPLLTQGERERQIRFRASTDVTRGGCRVHTRFGTIDATRETKFHLMKRALLS
jgi:flagellar biosynthesis/type III secretory pathway protein FliH